MKRVIINILFLLPMLLSAADHYGQVAIRGKYDTDQAKEALSKKFFNSDFWRMPTDTSGVCYFYNKKDARKTARIKVVPVYKVIRSGDQVIFDADFTVYVGLLFKDNSFLSGFNVWANQSSKKREQEIVLVEDPPPGFLNYVEKNGVGYVLADNAFLVFEDGIGKAWNYRTKSYQPYLPTKSEKGNEIKNEIDSQQELTQAVHTIEYLLKQNPFRDQWLLKYQGKNDTIVIYGTERIPDTELYRNWVEFKGKRYSLEYGGFKWVYNSNHDMLVSYLPDSGLIDDGKTKTDFRIVKEKAGRNFKFIDSSSSRKLLTAQYTKKNSEDYLAIQINADRHLGLLELTATLVFWEMWMKK